jgi:hypothetical protein
MQTIAKNLLIVMCLSNALQAQNWAGKKCTTFDRFLTPVPPGVHNKIIAASDRPVLQASTLSPSKKFRIHYDTVGVNQPAMVTLSGDRIPNTVGQYVDTVARLFDSVWTAEVTTFGFAAPAPDNGEGGGDEFDVYIQDLGPNSFGYTSWNESTPIPGNTAAPRYPTYIVIDNDYGRGFRTIGMDALKSTAAHEFHHAIQVSEYGLWGTNDFYFYEISAESMEATVFPSSKDYIFDIPNYFENIESISLYSPFSGSHPGYERAIWSLFLMKRYGVGILRQIWESIAVRSPILSMKTVLESNGTSLGKEFSEFCYWNYFTGPRGDSVKYYPDSRLFPIVDIRDRELLGNSAVLYQYPCPGFTVNYLQSIHVVDTVSFIIANVNMDDALGSQSNTYGYQLSASLSPISGASSLSNGWYVNFTVADPSNWNFIAILSSTSSNNGPIVCFPNPFHPTSALLMIGPITLSPGDKTPELSVLSASNKVVFSGNLSVQSFNGNTYAVWNGKDARGEIVASGIYIYFLSTEGRLAKGKFAVIR